MSRNHNHHERHDEHYDGTADHAANRKLDDMAQSVKYSILVGPGGYIVLDLDTARVISGSDRAVAANQLRDAIDAEFPRPDLIERPQYVTLFDADGNVIDTIGDDPTP